MTGINQFFIFFSKCLVTTLFFFHQLFEVGASWSETPELLVLCVICFLAVFEAIKNITREN